MGLIEKRLIKLGQEEWVPTAQKELRELSQGEQTYEVDWDAFASDVTGLNNIENQCLRRINSAFRLICCDDLGKEAANESVKKIAIQNTAKIADKAVTLKEGVLTVRGAWGLGPDGQFADIELKQIIEKLL